jgi:hypothetical protein
MLLHGKASVHARKLRAKHEALCRDIFFLLEKYFCDKNIYHLVFLAKDLNQSTRFDQRL